MSDPRKSQSWGLALTLGWELVVGVLGGFYLGEWLDNRYDSSPIAMLLCVLLLPTLMMFPTIRKIMKDL